MSKEYFKITDEEISKAKNADIAQMLLLRGERLEKQSGQFVWHRNGHKIAIKGHIWFDFYAGEGGNAIDFAMNYFSLPFPEAVKCCLLGDFDYDSNFPHQKIHIKPKNPNKIAKNKA